MTSACLEQKPAPTRALGHLCFIHHVSNLFMAWSIVSRPPKHGTGQQNKTLNWLLDLTNILICLSMNCIKKKKDMCLHRRIWKETKLSTLSLTPPFIIQQWGSRLTGYSGISRSTLSLGCHAYDYCYPAFQLHYHNLCEETWWIIKILSPPSMSPQDTAARRIQRIQESAGKLLTEGAASLSPVQWMI